MRPHAQPIVVALGGWPQEIALCDDGTILALVSSGPERWIAALDKDGQEISRASLRGWEVGDRIRYSPHPLRIAEDGTAWVESEHRLLRFASDGSQLASIEAGAPGDEIMSFLLLPDGFVACLYAPDRPKAPPRVVRLHSDGTSVWASKLSSAMLGRDLHLVPHTQPMLASGRSLLVSFEEIGGGFARSICLDIRTGKRRWESEAGPQNSQAIIAPDWFLIGWQGYGAHHMVVLNPEGRKGAGWDQHAWVVIGRDGTISGPEMENIVPSHSTFSRFRWGLPVERGVALGGYYTSFPALTATGWVVFWRESEGLVGIDPAGAKHTLWAGGDDARSYGTRVVVSPSGSVLFGVAQSLCIVPTELGPLAEGPWPCGGLNARNNPVDLAVAPPARGWIGRLLRSNG
jgi:hypothetical protein